MEAKTSYEIYLERYCKTYHITPEEAEQHVIVKDVKAYYEENENRRLK